MPIVKWQRTAQHVLIMNSNPYVLAVFVALAIRAKEDGRKVSCFPGVERISKDTGISQRKVITCIKTLENQGIVERRYTSQHRSKLTILNLL